MSSSDDARNLSIAICIPTHGRPDLVKEALASVLEQTHAPSEVLVSDDCGDPKVRELVEEVASKAPFPIRYLHCTDGPGQAQNVNHCLRAVCSDLLLLLHDDDLLFPRCLEILIRPFLSDPSLIATYGRQMFVDNAGREVPGLSEPINQHHRRTPDRIGIQKCSLCTAIIGQFPNNGYLIRSEVAKGVGVDAARGAALDRDFAIRCASSGPFFYTGELTSKYRLSDDSIIRGKGRNSDDSAFMFARLLEELQPLDAECKATIAHSYREILPSAIAQAGQLKRPKAGWRWYFSKEHARRILTPGGLRRAALLLGATLKTLKR